MGKVYIKVQQQYFRPEDRDMWFTKSITYTKIGFDTLVKHVSADSGIRIEQIAAVYRSLFVQVRELVCNGHSVQLGDLGTLNFTIHAKIQDERADAGGDSVWKKRIRFNASKIMRQKLAEVNFVS